jgi:hypothetical protein
MMRLFVGVVVGVSVCGECIAQVATPSQPAPQPISARPEPVALTPQTPPAQNTPKPLPDAVGTGEKVDLHAKWSKGDTAKYEFEFFSRWTSFMSEEDGGKKGGQLYRGTGRILRRVLSADDKGVTLSFMLERLHMQVSTGTVVTHYDSDFGDAPDRKNDLTAPVNATVNRPITVRVGSDGQVVSIEGNEDPEPDPNKPEDAQAPHVIQGIIGTPVIRTLWKPLYAIDKKSLDSHVGDRWTTDDMNSDPSLGTFGVTLHHELKSEKDGIAKIQTIGEVDFTPAIGHNVIHGTLTGYTVTGDVEWDLAKGMLKSWSTSQEMKMDLERAGEKQRRETQVKTIFTRVEPGAAKDTVKDPKASTGAPAVPATPAGKP